MRGQSALLFYSIGKLVSNICNSHIWWLYINNKAICNLLTKIFVKLYNYIKQLVNSTIELSTEIILFTTSPLYIIKGYFDCMHCNYNSNIALCAAHFNTLFVIYFIWKYIAFIKNYELFSFKCLMVDLTDY